MLFAFTRVCKDYADNNLAKDWSLRVSPAARRWSYRFNPRPSVCIRISAYLNNRSYKPIHLESKVGSPLRKDQLQKYKESGTKILVAITKHWPEVSQEWLHRKQVKSMRWQDICRALRQAKCHGQKNRFICDNFRAYLEESEIAFREDITEKDLEDLRSLFLRIASPKTNDSKAPRAAFLTANDCIGLLQDVRRLTQEKLPIFSDKKSGSRLVHGTIMITIQMAHQSRTTGLALPFTKENGTNDGA